MTEKIMWLFLSVVDLEWFYNIAEKLCTADLFFCIGMKELLTAQQK